jgi:hypothetical protein
MSIYERLVSIGATIHNNRSDLQVLLTEPVKQVIADYEYKRSIEYFNSAIDNKPWCVIPFAYDLFWK